MEKLDERWKAIIGALAVIIVNACALMGIDIEDGMTVENALYAVAWLVSIGWAIWKNFNFTLAAAEGQRVVDAAKHIKKTVGVDVSAEMALELTGGKDDEE